MDTTSGKAFNRNEIPVKFGIITGLILSVLSTIQYMFFTESYGVMMGFMIFIFIAAVVMYFITGVQQRKALGGFIDIKQAFSAIFITILIATAISYAYNLLYMKVIDPDVMDRISNTSIEFAEKMGAPADKLDEVAEQVEQRKADSEKIGNQILSFFSQIVIHSIFGIICAAIVKRKNPQQTA